MVVNQEYSDGTFWQWVSYAEEFRLYKIERYWKSTHGPIPVFRKVAGFKIKK